MGRKANKRTGTPQRVRGGGSAPSASARVGEIEGANRAARKEEARRQREAIRRREVRRRRIRLFALIALGAAAVAVVAVLVIVNAGGGGGATKPSGKTLAQQEQQLLGQASSAAQAAGCSTVQEVAPYKTDPNSDRVHLATGQAMPPLTSYTTQPPASGPHNVVPLNAGVYPAAPPLDQAIHSLEHAAVIVWYSPSASGSQLDQLKSFFGNKKEQYKVILAPYQYGQPGGTLPGGEQMALVAWHKLQTCKSVSLPVAFSFVHSYRFDSLDQAAYKGEAPEPNTPI